MENTIKLLREKLSRFHDEILISAMDSATADLFNL
jgi:hypothetical protein